MERFKLTARDEYGFVVGIAVRTTDLNYGGHLANDRLLALLHEARVAFLAAYGWTELNCGGPGMIMTDAAVNYRAEAFAGDHLRIEVAAFAPARTGFRLAYRVIREQDGALVALAESGQASFDYTRRKVVALPDAVRQICQEP